MFLDRRLVAFGLVAVVILLGILAYVVFWPTEETRLKLPTISPLHELNFDGQYLRNHSGSDGSGYEIEEGTFRIWNNRAGSIYRKSFFWNVGDFVLTVKTWPEKRPENLVAVGVAFRSSIDQSGFDCSKITSGYTFKVNTQGEFAIRKEIEDEFEHLIPYTSSPHLNEDTGVNQLAIKASGAELQFYANGVRVANVSDTALSEGSICLRVGSEEPQMRTHFDDMRLWSEENDVKVWSRVTRVFQGGERGGEDASIIR